MMTGGDVLGVGVRRTGQPRSQGRADRVLRRIDRAPRGRGRDMARDDRAKPICLDRW